MLRTLSILLLVSMTILSTACASKKQRPQPAIYFSTSITQDGSKYFVYSLERPQKPDREGRQRPPQGMKGDKPRRGGSAEQDTRAARSGNSKDALKQQVDALIAGNRYCVDGYVVLEQYAGAGFTSLRGECRDGATAEDRIRFRNPV